MDIQIERIDISNMLASAPDDPNWTPTVFLKRTLVDGNMPRVPYATAKASTDEKWITFSHKVGEPAKEDWSSDRSSERIRVPLYSYKLRDDSADILVHLGAQLGAFAAASTGEMGAVERLIVFIGNVFSSDDEVGYVCWLGFAAQLK